MTKIICLKIIFPNVIKSKAFQYPSIVFLSIFAMSQHMGFWYLSHKHKFYLINAHVDEYSGARGLKFGLSLYLLPYRSLVRLSVMRILTPAFAACWCEKHRKHELAHIYKRTLKTHHYNFSIFSQTVNAIEKLLAAFNVQLKIGMNQTLI